MSHVDMTFDILAKAGRSLHVSALIDRIEQAFGIRLDSESLVSALSKRVARADRFTRTAPNTFGLLDLSQEPPAKAASKPAASARRSPSKNQSPKKSHEPK
jgi:hypothetical protein